MKTLSLSILGGLMFGAVAISNAHAVLVQSLNNTVANGTIVIGGNGSGWTGLTSFVADPNEGSNLDWKQITIANDGTNYYFRYEMYASVTWDWTYSVYLDTDLDRSTGFVGGGDQFSIGADLVIQGTSILSYPASAGTDWSSSVPFSSIGLYSWSGDDANPYQFIEFAIPIATLGTNSFNFLLLGTGNLISDGSWYEDYYLDDSNQGETGGFFQYTTAPVPEPATAALFGIGLAWMMLRRPRRSC